MDRASNLFSERRLQECLQGVKEVVPAELIRGAVRVVKQFAAGA